MPLEAFTSKGSKGSGRGSRCYPCHAAWRRERRAEQAAQEGRTIKRRVAFDAASGVRRCRACETDRPVDAFARGQRECRDCRSARNARYRREHADRESERHRRDYAANRERRGASVKRARQTEKGKESARRAARRYWHRHSSDEKRAILRKWSESRYVNQALRRARLAGTKMEPIRRAAVVARDRRTCYLCGRSGLPDAEIHLDHVIPLSRGGTHTYDNIRVACAPCNYRKSNRLLA